MHCIYLQPIPKNHRPSKCVIFELPMRNATVTCVVVDEKFIISNITKCNRYEIRHPLSNDYDKYCAFF